MENRKYVIVLALIIFFGIGYTNHNKVLAYGYNTHAYLTQEAVNFYNKNFSDNKIDDNLRAFLIDGSRREDDTPRWMNHFYDPVNNRGITYDPVIDVAIPIVGDWVSSKVWSQSPATQDKLVYKVSETIGSILTAIQQHDISKVTAETNFTWQKAVNLYLNGDKSGAMFALGHVLHLLEDLSVPAHTRDDPHISDDSYELYSDKFQISSPDINLSKALANLAPIKLADLESYFQSLATYTNNNFYSDDTIGINRGYSKPEIDLVNVEDIGGYTYAASYIDHQRYYLTTKSSGTEIFSKASNMRIDDIVQRSYWNILSQKSVQYSAGLINLFFTEVAKAEADPQYAKAFDVEPKSFIGRAADSLASFAAAVKTAAVSAFTQIVGGNNDYLVQTIDVSSSSPSANGSQASIAPAAGKKYAVRITEIMYNPAGADGGKEWFEVYNADSESVDLSSLSARIGGSNHKIKADITSRGDLAPGAYAVVADDADAFRSTYPNYSGLALDSVVSLNNSGSEIALVNGEVVLNSVKYSAGQGASGDGGSLQLINGRWMPGEPTPGRTNKLIVKPPEETTSSLKISATSSDFATSTDKAIASSTSDAVKPKQEKVVNATATSTGVAACPFATSATLVDKKVIINEVAWMGSLSGAENEWIELKNISPSLVDISGWQLLSGDGDIKIIIPAGSILSPSGLYLLERTDDNSVPGIKADLIYKGGLANSGEELKFLDNRCAAADAIQASSGWPAGDAVTKRTMERDASGLGWHTSAGIGGTPRAENGAAFIPLTSGGGGGVYQAPAASSQNQTSSEPLTYPKILITEIQLASASSTKDEFAEIFNPNSTGVDLTGWSLMKKTKTGSEFSTFAKADLFQGRILPPSGYLVVSNPEGGISGDISSTYGIAADNTLVVKNPNHEIADRVGWGNANDCEGSCAPSPESGQSIRRKIADGAFLDSDNNATDFEINTCPSPGSSSTACAGASSSLPLISGFLSGYDKNTLKISLHWDKFEPTSTLADASGTPTSTEVFYSVQLADYIGNAVDWGGNYDAGLITSSTPATSAEKIIDEVGRFYHFRVVARDADGKALASATSSVDVSSFLSNVYFYRDPRPGADSYLIDLYYAGLPFIPPVWSGTPGTQTNWRMLGFYLDSEADKSGLLASGTGAAAVKYQSCGGGLMVSPAIVFPQGLCEYGPNLTDLSPQILEDPHLLLSLASSTAELNLSTSSYLTIGYFDLDPGVIGERRFKLAATDRRHYELRDLSLAEAQNLHAAPELISPLRAEFKKDVSALVVSWDPARDSDTLDSLIGYEINLSPDSGLDASFWQPLVPEPRADFSDPQSSSYRYARIVNPGDKYLVTLRARDEFGKSAETSTIWSYATTTIVLEQGQWSGEWSGGFGGVDTHLNPYFSPDSASFQRLSSADGLTFDRFTVKVRQSGNGGMAPTDLRLSIYADAAGSPDFTNPLGESVVRNMDPVTEQQDITFSFGAPVSLPIEGGWAVLDVAGYFSPQGYWYNSWQNAVASGDPYAGGGAGFGGGRGNNGDCSLCPFGGYSSGSDWYMKLGLAQS